jgi:hypothetical protein
MTIYDLLHKDHEEVAELLNKLENSSESAIKTRENTFSKVKKNLSLIARPNNKLFTPPLKTTKRRTS